MNHTSVYPVVDFTTSCLGFAIVLENIVIAILITKLRISTKTNSFILLQFLFVSINDLLSGGVLSILGFIRVYGEFGARFCVYAYLLSMSLQMMSQWNILCICFQRFIATKNILNTRVEPQLCRALVLFSVNALVGTSSLVFGLSRVSILPLEQIQWGFCSIRSVLGKYLSAKIGSVYYSLGIIVIICADLFCFMTIRKLKCMMNSIINPSEETGDVANSIACIRKSMKMHQEKAIKTLCIILTLLNISYLPSIAGYKIAFIGPKMTVLEARWLYLSLFLNSLLNPIIMLLTVEAIGKEFHKTFLGLIETANKLCRFC